MNTRVFREYDIRGNADRDFPDSFVTDLGRATGTFLLEGGAQTITLGRDCRVSSPRIHAALRAGLLSTGIDIVDVGILHSPGLYFSVFHLGVGGGVMVTASHNPGEDNGFKIVQGKSTIHGAAIQRLRELMQTQAFRVGARPGSVRDHAILPDYVTTIVDNVKLGPRRFKVVVDAGNGTGGLSILPILDRLGIAYEAIYCDPDGRFPNHHPDPTVPENLQDLRARVLATGAELGIALDGDADRIGAVDARGRIVFGDQLLALFARDVLTRVPGSEIIFDVKCSQGLIEDIVAHGGRPSMWKTGHSLIKSRLHETGAPLAGEMSGHMFFNEGFFGFDDALFAAGRLLRYVAATGKSFAELVDSIPHYFATPETRLSCPEEKKLAIVETIRKEFAGRYKVIDIDGVRVEFGDGWGLVRASNTQPVLVVRFEARTPERLEEIRELFMEPLRRLGVGEATVGH